jgi:ribose transport system ATP-binding protein
LREQGRAVGFISHRLAEVLDVSDDITVMRDGRVVADFSEPVTEDELIRIMVDREVGLYRAARPDHADRVLLSVEGLTTDHVRDVTFDAREGEIVGFAGLVGAGRTEAALAVAGADAVRSGSVRVDGQEMAGRSVARLRRAGVVLVPEDRKGQGIAPGLSVHENLHLGNLPAFTRFGLLDGRRLRRASEELRGRFDIRLRSLNQPIETLSGGNQQKAILARAMETKPKVLVLDEPTRGVDVRAKDEIHQMILRLAAQGTTVLLISSELEEVMALSHRLVVFAEGTVTGQLVNDESVTPETVMRLATPRSVRMGARIA